ncbi:hypothetical protein LOZ53_006595 [Ophidiomyces ophidiicola]|nr:hypothetical protein LOZ55_005882 [Ophidiomyces ophidiicola]KAI1980706.1 hypothetical protein LOZ53_006595 [Ophidiomyces ophidiicola]KAI1991241.1 hypothetical protein LOZ54_002236 [Ophidiomyces ophidiicola]KAI1995696.1 hypothetical protein LOZ51_003522 [Ophidiomyces ophidiicola]
MDKGKRRDKGKQPIDFEGYHGIPGGPYEETRVRRNSEAPISALQYNSPRGNIPGRGALETAYNAPENTTSKFPKTYRNLEGLEGDAKQLFDPKWEARKRELSEPIPPSERRGIMDPDNKKARVPNDPGPQRVIWASPKDQYSREDGGVFTPHSRLDVENPHGRELLGTTYHPEGTTRGFERSRLSPLDRQGRQDDQRYRDRSISRGRHSESWPSR